MTRKKISYTDYAILRMDDPHNLMVITGLMTFDEPLDYARLITTIEHTLLPLGRFRQRLVPPKAPFRRPYWEDDPNFNLESHLTRLTLPPPANQEALMDLISRLMSTALEPSRPLWQFHLVENYGKGGAFIARIHHSIADGIALMQAMLSLTDTNPVPPDPDHKQSTNQSGLPSQSRPNKTHKSSILDPGRLTKENLW